MKRYAIITLVFVCSLTGAWLLPVSELFKGIFSTPAILALVGALFHLFRDEVLHMKTIELQRQQHLFNLGAMSHMANVAFDKHVEFCERYMAEVHETLSTLFKEGPTKKTLEHADELNVIKQEFAAWVTDDINEELLPFEQSLRNLGENRELVTMTSGESDEENLRKDAIKKSWDEFNKILTIQGEQPDEHVAIETIKKKIREILDIEDLTKLRKGLIRQAQSSLGTHN